MGNAFIDSYISYASLMWMYCIKAFNSKIEKNHFKSVYGIDDSYNSLLLHRNAVSIHQKHLWFLVIEIFKSISEINSEFMWSTFKQILQFNKGTYYKLRPRTMVQILITFEVLWYRIIFLLKVSQAIQFSILKPFFFRIVQNMRQAWNLFLWKFHRNLYSGHLVIEATFFRNRRCPLKTLR